MEDSSHLWRSGRTRTPPIVNVSLNPGGQRTESAYFAAILESQLVEAVFLGQLPLQQQHVACSWWLAAVLLAFLAPGS